jgi:hypothetical protein
MRKFIVIAALFLAGDAAAAAQTSKFGIPSTSGAGGVQILMSTVAQLPTCDVSHIGMLRGVVDAATPLVLGQQLAAGGATTHLALCNGTVWTVR